MTEPAQSEGDRPDGPETAGAETSLPRTIKHFKVVREIGSGGMGRVLKCLDTTLNRYVALKMLRPELSAGGNFVERFRREALAVAKTRHPNIVHLYSIDQDEGRVFYTMEYVEGEGLDRVLERRSVLPEREAVEIIRQAAEGLCHVHRSGILHRDLKPSNILLDSSDRVYLTDFGLAKMEFQQILRAGAASEEKDSPRPLGETDPGHVMGTPHYMAPECITGRAPDVRSDIYALGVVFYEMLTGRPPFDGETAAQIFQAHLDDIPIPIGEITPQTTLPVANIVYRCIEKDPGARYSDCRDLLEDLNRIVAEWHMAKEIEEKKRLSLEIASAMRMESRPSANRQRGRFVALALLLLLAVALLIVLGETFRDITPPPSGAGSAQTDAGLPAGKTARIYGTVLDMPRDAEDYVIRVHRNWNQERPLVTVRVSAEVWDRIPGPVRPQPERGAVFVGRVNADADGSPSLRVLNERGVWRPGALRLQALDDPRWITVPLHAFRALEKGTPVRASGMIVFRDAEGSRLVLADGRDAVEVRFAPENSAGELRIGDIVTLLAGKRGDPDGEDPSGGGAPRIEEAVLSEPR